MTVSVHFCGKFDTGRMNQTVFRRELVKLLWGNENYLEPP